MLPALVASIGWVSNKRAERRERRAEKYAKLVEGMSAFTKGTAPERINAFLSDVRHLWLIAPRSVLHAIEKFIAGVEKPEKDTNHEENLREAVLAMRADVIGWGTFRWSIQESVFKLRNAREADPIAPPKDHRGFLISTSVANSAPSGSAVGPTDVRG